MERVTQVYAVMFIGIGFVMYGIRLGKATVITDLSVAFFGVYLVCTFVYVRAHMINRKKRDTKM